LLPVTPVEVSSPATYRHAPIDPPPEYISGFTGSAGYAVITHDKAALSTDGRYFNQAEKQLDGNWELLKQGIQDVPTIQEWTADRVEGGKVVGVDPRVVTAGDARKLADKIKKRGGEYKAIDENLIDVVWGDARPARPSETVIVHPAEYSGKGTDDKIADLRKELEKRKSLGFVVSMLDEIAWLFNIRGSEYV
jgi:Xaa-Pro aminopeptidase